MDEYADIYCDAYVDKHGYLFINWDSHIYSDTDVYFDAIYDEYAYWDSDYYGYAIPDVGNHANGYLNAHTPGGSL